MWLLVLQLIFAGFYLQPATCHPSCQLWGQKADCAAQNLSWVPVLPPNITHLYLDRNLIHEINRTSFRDLKELQELDLGSQKVVLTIRNDSFLRQRKLTTLVLGDNVGLKLEPRAFAGLVRLRDLWLDYCSLTDSILAENYLKPLLSLERLNLYGNHIVRLNPGQFFRNLTKFSQLILELNQLEKICEKDLFGFQGKYFHLLSLRSNSFFRSDVDWKDCGNPFKEMAFNILDISGSGMNLESLKLFFRAIRGTLIAHLKCSGSLGKDFSYNNIPDPDKDTFQGLEESSVVNLDLTGNRIFALKTGVFRALKDAKMIDISRNKINFIETNAFVGLEKNLLQLNLSSNLLGEIRSDTFSNLTELLILDLSNNHIGVLGDKAFSGLSQLHHLYLTGNSLRQLASPAPLPNLEFLLLRDNKLNSIRSIKGLWNSSHYLDISENRLTNLEDLYVVSSHFKRLLYFFYGGNTILWCTINPGVSMSPNNSLVVLDLHGSSLQISWAQGHCLDIFDNFQNLIGLNISLNSLMTLPHGVFRGLTSIRNIDLSSNALTYLEASVFPASLKSLDLSNNFLVSPDPMTFHSLSALDLSGNRFHCDCALEGFLKWLNTTNVTFLSPSQEYRCEFPASFHNLPLLEFPTIMESCEDEEKDVQAFQLALFISSAILIFSLVLGGIIYARLRGQIFIIYKKVVNRVLEGPKPPAQENNWQYDAFLCFSNSDYRWVEAALLKKLDNQFAEENLFHCCFEARDFLPGEDHLSNIRDAIWGSRKTLCIVSKEFLKDGWCLEAFTLAQGRMLEELTNVLVMLVVGKVAHYQLMKCNAVRAFVQRREYLTWPEDPQDLEWFYERLVSLILRDTKVKKFAEDKPETVKPDCQPPAKEKIPLENIRVNNLTGNP